MRRNEFDVIDPTEIEPFLQEMSFGFLGMSGSEEGWPLIIPINFVYYQGSIYIHGSKIGEKMSKMKRNSKVTFSVAKEYAIIPSYFSDPVFACPATSYFKSVFIRGYASILEDVTEKAEALTAFMGKLQPEGGFKPIDAADTQYIPRISGVAVIKITIDTLRAKFKFGQNLKEKTLDKVLNGLEHRGLELDRDTAELMRKYCPHHK